MNPKIKKTRGDINTASGSATPALKPAAIRRIEAETKAADRRPKVPVQPASGQADHARHHVARGAQA